jgi:hypothetical protein
LISVLSLSVPRGGAQMLTQEKTNAGKLDRYSTKTFRYG